VLCCCGNAGRHDVDCRQQADAVTDGVVPSFADQLAAAIMLVFLLAVATCAVVSLIGGW
jgi:ABC-type spermidine/putrescine transport system permease subunit I